MKIRVILLFLSSILIGISFGQNERLSPIGQNSSLQQYAGQAKLDFVYENIVLTSDTLSLPFIDEFSIPSLRPYDFALTTISDTSLYAAGNCIENGDFTLQTGYFNTNPSFTYFYDTINDVVDSVVNASLSVEFFGASTCFPTPSNTSVFWPLAYTFTFDSISGAKLDSVALPADSSFQFAAIYFGTLHPNAKWIDNYAFQNTTFPVDPPTIGVATLDGLNEFGRPYNNSVVNPVGNADVLTSKPIDLSGLMNDSAVFVSFFVQAQGRGDLPNTPDSLVLEFKNEFEQEWVKVWGINIDDLATDKFKQYYVEVRDTNLVAGPRYFYEDFQFRFRNIASLSGNNDHWHIDYVRLDKDRSLLEQDTVIRDVAFLYDFPNTLAKYSMLPWSQFQAGADSFASEIEIPIRDNGQINGVSAGSFPIAVLVTDSLDTDTIFELNGLNFNPTSEIKNQVFMPISDFVKPNFQGDSICLNAGMGIYPTSRNLIFSNDTTFSQICFDKVMAYDDGSAERAYGLSGNPNEVKKFAYKFNVAHPDTLAAIQVHFSNIDEDVSNLVFSFYAWDSLEINQPLSYENQIGVIENKKPSYIDLVNGFVTFAFDTPILVTDDFYIGWAQTDSRNLQIGFDKNSTKGRAHMYTYTSSTWRPSSITEEGSPMLRAVLDADFVFEPPTGIQSVYTNSVLEVYPNPSHDIFNIYLPEDGYKNSLMVYDLSGNLILNQTNSLQINLSQYSSGMYLLQVSVGNNSYRAKLIKR
tara:strand:- start:9746 stop:11998 length:2253 start_codon:yes stop_codon:yes gene_type:complete